MNGIDLLKKFAESKGISEKEVHEFLREHNSPKTLDDVLALPHDLQKHEKYITWVGEPLQSFISDEMWCERYKTIKVDRIVECIYDRIYSLFDMEEDDDFDIDEIGIENVTIDDEENKEKLEYYKSVAKYIINTKFGSVIYDW